MHRFRLYLLSASLLAPGAVAQQTSAPAKAVLRPLETIKLPAEIKGNFDHFEVDTRRQRLFATPEDSHSVLVIDIASGELIRRIPSIERPHAVLYRADLDRLYITDGADGSLKIYDAETYQLLHRVPLLKDADSIGYDISRQFLYVDNGGGELHQSFSMLSVIDTTTAMKLADIRIEGDTLEAMALDNYRPRLYVNDKAKNSVIVVDRLKNTVTATWPVTMGKGNVAMALDEQRQRLFVACRDGHVIVFDSNTGKELQVLPITSGVDDLVYDPASRRIYAFGGGAIDVFDQASPDTYNARGSIAIGSGARNGKLVPSLNRIFVAAPSVGAQPASIHVLEPVNTRKAEPPLSSPLTRVDAPMAEALVLETLSAHPSLRRMGLHVVPPGRQQMVLIANGNATRIGIATSDSDFAATKDGRTSGPLSPDGFYNMKMPMFDAAHRSIGILVMEIPTTSAASEADARQQAEAIRLELASQIPSLEALFGAS